VHRKTQPKETAWIKDSRPSAVKQEREQTKQKKRPRNRRNERV